MPKYKVIRSGVSLIKVVKDKTSGKDISVPDRKAVGDIIDITEKKAAALENKVEPIKAKKEKKQEAVKGDSK